MGSTRFNVRLSAFSLFLTFAMIVLSSVLIFCAGQQLIDSPITIDFEASAVLTVSQPINQTDPSWTKVGKNLSYTAGATKINKTSMSDLTAILDNKDAFGNISSALYGADTYMNAPVYKDIDIANIDLATGEILGYLSDPSYPFEWFGRSVTLPAGRTLASGRTLTSQTTFAEVDCYTKFPTMYIRRYIENNVQYLSVSDKTFDGAVKIDEFYVGTFEARMIDANNKTTIYPRSFIPTNGAGPLTSGSLSYAVTNYGTIDSANIKGTSTTQAQMQAWMDNLTNKWKNSGFNSTTYKSAKGCQGENWKRDVINILYLIKYANNNSQEQVGYGASYNYDKSTGSNKYYDSEKGGGTVTTYSSALTYGYDQTYQNSHINSNNIDIVNSTDPKGLYAPQFLVKNINDGTKTTKRVLLDGFVGTDKYAGVFCLGMANLWGNVQEWTFGETAVYDSTAKTKNAYVNFNDYDGSNWVLSNSPSSVTSSSQYVKLSYNLPTSGGYYTNLSASTGGSTYESIVGFVSSGTTTASSSTGLCDYYYGSGTSTGYVYGVLRGGFVSNRNAAGLFLIDVYGSLTDADVVIGFRPSLILG